jgi:hypothetical protein
MNERSTKSCSNTGYQEGATELVVHLDSDHISVVELK